MFIDTHVHIGPVWDSYRPLTPEEMLQWMDAHEVERAVPLPLESPESGSYYILSRETLEICRRWPDRFIPFCVIDPRMSVSRGAESFRRMIQRYVDEGVRGFGEVKVGLPIDDERLQWIYAACEEFHLPLVFHCDAIRCTDTPDLRGLEAMLRKFPDLIFVGHAPGFWAAISADVRAEDMGAYPKRPVVPGGPLERLFSTYSNLYADLSAMSAYNALTRDWEYGQQFMERFHRQLLFATDYLHPDQEVPQFQMFADAQLSDEARRAIARENAIRILRLDE